MKLVTALLFILLLSACSSKPPTAADVAPEQRFSVYKQQVNSWSQWEARGKWAIKQGSQKGSAYFNWRHPSSQQDKLILTTFIGSTLFKAEQQPQHATVEADGKTLTGYTLQPLIAQLTGWNIPINALRNWLLGLPYSKQAKLSFNKYGQLTTITEPGFTDAWQIKYSRPDANVDVPQRITVRYGDLWLKLAITHWQTD